MAREHGQRGAETAAYRAVGPAPDSGGRERRERRERAAERAGWIVAAVALPAADLAALAAAAAVAGWGILPSALYACAVLILLAASGLNRLRICLRVADQAVRILACTALPVVFLLPWLPEPTATKLALTSAALVIACRTVISAALLVAQRHGLVSQPTLVVGAGTFGVHISELMLAHPELGLRPRGFLEAGPPRRDLPLPCLGNPADLAEIVESFGIRRVLVCYSACRDEDLVAIMRASGPLRADVCVVPRLYELGAAVPRSSLDEFWGIPLVPLRRFIPRSAGAATKRAFDVVTATVLLALSLPLLLLLLIAIRLESGQAPVFRQKRVTDGDRHTTILKLRTIIAHREPDTSWTVTAQHSTRLGRWLRATHIDELPQLVNVLRGEMSLVGPRPERPYFAEKFGREIQRYSDRTRMPAGITGWAQVHGLHGDTSIVERARFDNQYIEYWSLWLDVVILAKTLPRVLGWRRAGP